MLYAAPSEGRCVVALAGPGETAVAFSNVAPLGSISRRDAFAV
jgi:hypothetical protein